jgi:hypothetical protein
MTAAPLIEAVRRAGGTILVHGEHLRLSAPAPLPDRLIAKVRRHKAEILEALGADERSVSEGPWPSAPARPIGAAVEAWRRGTARLRSMPPPRGYPERAWTELLADAEHFLERWGMQAARLGWQDWELFGCHRRAPFHRIQGKGLVLLLRGDAIAALTGTEAVIRTPTGAHQTYRRKPRDPLHPAERCLVWELS